jgi:hypothetical protein
VSATVLGTFPSGFPRGDPLDYETTLLELGFEKGESGYAIRWNNGKIAATEFPRFTLAADAAIQPLANGDMVSWNIVFSAGLRFTPQIEGSRASSLVVHTVAGDVVATAVPPIEPS